MQNLNHLMALLQEGYTTVKVVFAKIEDDNGPWHPDKQQRGTSQQYTYKCPLTLGIANGDMVILPPSNPGKLPSIGTVVQVDDEPDLNFEAGIEYKWLVGKVDMTGYDAILTKEKQMTSILRDTERKKQREALLQHYQLSLPDDAESRKIFDQVRQIGVPDIKG